MKRALLIAGLAAAAVLSAQSAWAAPTTEIVQGDVIRLESVADWDATSSLTPGEPVQWDVAISADAPDPGTVTIGVSATGGTALVIDASLCMQPWTANGCPGGETELRSGWDIPRDGGETAIARMADTETAHVRMSIALASGGDGARTDVRLHASGVGEAVVVGQDGGLATTGMSPVVFWVLGGGVLLLVVGVVLVVARRRRSRDEEDES
jgi:hypothetical protein